MAGRSRQQQPRVQLDLRICMLCENYQYQRVGHLVSEQVEHIYRCGLTFMPIPGCVDIPKGCPYELEQIMYMAHVDYMPVAETYYSGA